MPTKIHKLVDSPGGEHYALNSSKSRMYAHAGAEWWYACSDLKFFESETDLNLWSLMWVGLPMMHMSLELMVKAIVTFYDPNYDTKSDNHRTYVIVNKFSGNINVLKLLSDDKEKMRVIKTFEKAWEGLRYAECSLEYDGNDGKLFAEIMTLLIEEYKKISKLNTL